MGTSTRALVRGEVSSHTARCVHQTRMAYAFALSSYKSANAAGTPAAQTSWRLSLCSHGCKLTAQCGTDFRMLYCVRDSKVHARVSVYVSMFVFGVSQGVYHLKSIRFKCKMVSLSCIGGREASWLCVRIFTKSNGVFTPPLFILIFVRIWPLAIFQQKT